MKECTTEYLGVKEKYVHGFLKFYLFISYIKPNISPSSTNPTLVLK